MDPKKLLYFVSIVEEGSLKKAAVQLGVSQPALSTSMDRLEASLGIKLLDRGPSGVSPTPIGELIFSHARRIKDEVERAQFQIANQGQRQKRSLTAGLLPSLASSILPHAISAWRREHPSIRLRIVEKVQVNLLIGLLRSELDLIIGMTEYYNILDGLKQRVLFRDRQCVFARPRHPAFDLKEMSWGDLAKFAWICPLVGHQRTVLDDLLHSEGLAMPEQIIEGGSVQFVKSLVAGSDHLALLPTHAISQEVAEGKLRALPISAPQLERSIAYFHRTGFHLTKADRDFIANVQAIGRRLSREAPATAPSAKRSARSR